MAVSQRRNATPKTAPVVVTADDIVGQVKAQIVAGMTVREFSTGSVGAYGQGKVTVGGLHYQCSAQAVLIGSKLAAAQHAAKVKVAGKLVAAPQVTASIEAIRDSVTLMCDGLTARTFASGNTGFEVFGKIPAGDQSYQVTVRAINYTPKAK